MTPKLKEFLDKWKLNPECGASVGDGWLPLLEDLMEKLTKEFDFKPEQCCQIKEKFGGLRFYIDNATANQRIVIDDAEDASWHICETCGTRGKVKTEDSGWSRVLCEKCP